MWQPDILIKFLKQRQMLKIKDGVTLRPYGAGSELTADSAISQDALAHLQTRYPEDIEGELEETKETPANDKIKKVTKAQLLEMSDRVKAGAASVDEIALVEAAIKDSKI